MAIQFLNKGKGNASTKLNVYAQEIEPEGKDGIWLQTSKIFNKVYFDEQVKKITIEGWDTVNTYPDFTDTNVAVGHTSAMVGNYIYIFHLSKVHRYDIANNVFEENIASVGSNSFVGETTTCTNGTDIYLCGNGGLFKFDTLNNSITKVTTNSSTNHACARILAIDNCIYFFGNSGGGNVISKFDINTNEFITLKTDSPIMMGSPNYTSVVNIGHIVYIFGQYSSSSSYYKYSYKYDIDTNIFTRIADLPRVMYIRSCVVNNYIYLFGVDQSMSYKYNTLNDTYTPLTSKSFGTFGGYAYLYNNDKIIVVSNSPSSSVSKIAGYALTYDSVYNYENNSIVIWDGFGKYKTQLTESADNQEGKIQTLFYDAFHYTTQNGLDDTIPTYYGDGTQWVKFKN